MPDASRPNVILVYTDQQRFDTLGVNGNPLIRTPNLDAMARSGVHFTRPYVTTPICLPSRAGLFTGRYNHTNLSYNNNRWLLPRETDLATLFRRHGYHTALIGKDHCFGALRERAFDETILAGHLGFGSPGDDVERTIGAVRRELMQAPFANDPVPADDGITARLFRDARRHVDRVAGRPFFLWLSIPDPHPPYMVGAPYDRMYDDVAIPPPAWAEGEMADKPYRQRLVVEWDRFGAEYAGGRIDRLRRIYWGMVSCIDAELGRLLEHLRAAGLEEDTIVVFTSDHGDYMGDHRMVRKGPHAYEALARVPLIFRWGSRLPARSTDALAANIDIFPTLCELAGVPCPPQVQGVSLAGVLRGSAERAREMVFIEHGDPGTPLRPGDLPPGRLAELRAHSGHHLCAEICRGRTKAVRTDRWKYCCTPGDVDELYDLHADGDELHNLAADPRYADVVREHRDHLLRWEIETEDTLAS